MKTKIRKATHIIIDAPYLSQRTWAMASAGFSKPKWIHFCEVLMAEGYTIRLYEARETVSKYVTVIKGKMEYKVRFSNHRPAHRRELAGDCDFFVGVTNFGVYKTEDALVAVKEFFHESK